MIVLDASVIIKWFQDEADSGRALVFEKKHIRGEETVVVPDLLLYEITNVLSFQKRITASAAESALELLARMEIQVFTFSSLELKEVFRLARAYGISAYDAVYAVLALRLKCQFITADKKLCQKLKTLNWVFLL